MQNGYVCHCTVCQRSTGQPVEITVLIPAGALTYTGDQPRYYQSSASGKRGFCGHCGSRIVWQALEAKDDWLTNVTVGSLDHPELARVTRHIYADTQLPWYLLCDDLPKLTEADADHLIAMLREELQPDP
ncbi:MAG: GFA family protein [Paracoccaceae bacterium]